MRPQQTGSCAAAALHTPTIGIAHLHGVFREPGYEALCQHALRREVVEFGKRLVFPPQLCEADEQGDRVRRVDDGRALLHKCDDRLGRLRISRGVPSESQYVSAQHEEPRHPAEAPGTRVAATIPALVHVAQHNVHARQ
eukprot:scaffold15736_cov114-Isochrysis_galbana.AAC.2